MRKMSFFASTLFLAISVQVSAQSWLGKVGKQVKEKVIEKVEQRVEEKAEEATDKALDKTEEAIKKSISKNDVTSKKEEKEETEIETSNQQIADVSYAKYDFIPGNEILFEDDLKGEQKGEFPSKWDLIEGNAEIAQINGENVLAIVGFTYITPFSRIRTTNFRMPLLGN